MPLIHAEARMKKKVSNAELTYIFSERLKEVGGCSPRISIAIVPTQKSWKAVSNGWAEFKNPGCSARIERLQEQLREIYTLAKD
jgi:hypothetical protein